MRPSSRRQAFLFPLLFNLVVAHPYPRDGLQDAGFGYLMNRACASYCGADNQYCCSAGETCTTSSGIAGCATGAAGGEFDYYTTTWTETRTYTSTISSLLGPSTAAVGSGAPCVPKEGTQEIACGPICCASWQYCAHDGQCLPNNGVSSWTQWTTVGVVTTQYSAPYRVTSGSTIIQTPAPSTTTGTAASETASSTSTGAPAPVASTSGSLSGGAIAGIVVGTIAGVILLLLLCFCCIVRGLWDVFAGLFGGGRKKTEREEIDIIEERYSRRGSRHGSAYGAAARPVHRTWFGGGGGGRPASGASRKEKHSSSGAGWLAAGLGAAALLLGLRREDKRRSSSRRPTRTELSSSYYTDSYSRSSPSSSSSDRRTRDTRRSGRSRATRASRASRRSRRS